MKDESSPITPDEDVIRLIWEAFYQPDPHAKISESAFKPRADETDGISVFRAACLADPRDVLAVMAPERQSKYVLALLPVAEIIALGLTVQPAKIEQVSGHAVIPELNIDAFTADSRSSRVIQKALAAIAARNVIPPAGDANG